MSSPNGVVNYKGRYASQLWTVSCVWILKASLQNVLSTERITDSIIGEVNTIKPNLLQNIVGTAWDNKVLWTVPARMSDTNNEIIVADTTKTDSDAWQVWNIACQWIGVVSPQSQPAFLYVCRGNQILKLVEGEYARDEDSSGAFTQCLSTTRRLWSALTRLTTASSLSSRRCFYLLTPLATSSYTSTIVTTVQVKCGLSTRQSVSM